MIAKKITERIGQPNLSDILANDLTGSELTSLLIEVLSRKTHQMSPADLLRVYQQNRFVKPADVDVMGLRALEDQAFRLFNTAGFTPLELSPVAPLGSCSVVATADQKKVLSATRQTEVVADATNALALHIATLRQTESRERVAKQLRFSTIHRHIRTQTIPDLPGMRPHFKIACFVTAGRDVGNYAFERKALAEHFTLMASFIRGILHFDTLRFRLYPRKGYPDPVRFVNQVGQHLSQTNLPVEVMTDALNENNYYKGLQHKVTVTVGTEIVDIGDGGFVDWTQQLLQDKKERLLTTGIGIELLYRLLNPSTM